MNALALHIADTAIRTDAEGRLSLNDLHRASGGNPTHRPGEWLRNKQTQELVAEIGGAEIPAGPVATVNDGHNNGTYVVKELVYAYAMWISPAFHLKVIRAYDALMTKPRQELSRMDILKLALESEQRAVALEAKALALEHKTDEQAAQIQADRPKVAAFERLVKSEGNRCLRDAAGELKVRENEFFRLLQVNQWAYKRPPFSDWKAHVGPRERGYLTYTTVTYYDGKDGVYKNKPQLLVTALGLAKLALLIPKWRRREEETLLRDV